MRDCAGITCVAETTGRILLLRRSSRVPQPGLWSCPAGRVDRGEGPMKAAVRELGEEAGYWGPVLVSGPWVQRSKGRTFYHFLGVTPTQFRLKLNWENDAGGWFAPHRIPQPLHPGMAAFLQQL